MKIKLPNPKFNLAYFKDKRNWYHALVATPISMMLMLFFGFNNRQEYPLNWNDLRTLLAPTVTAIILGAIAKLSEKRQDKIRENSSDMRDVYFTMIASFGAGLLTLFWHNWYLIIFLTLLSIYLIIYKNKK